MADERVADFTAPATGGARITLSALRGNIVVLYFYPKDSTPGCTSEAQQFRDLHAQFVAAGCLILGVSRDSLRAHGNFSAREELPFALLADTDEALCRQFDVIRMKKLYGKEVRGIERSTFVIDRDGVLRKEWRGVRVPGHAAEVLDFVKTL